ncbi:hypothetical protein AAXE64_08030 [Priestia megaterium]
MDKNSVYIVQEGKGKEFLEFVAANSEESKKAMDKAKKFAEQSRVKEEE